MSDSDIRTPSRVPCVLLPYFKRDLGNISTGPPLITSSSLGGDKFWSQAKKWLRRVGHWEQRWKFWAVSGLNSRIHCLNGNTKRKSIVHLGVIGLWVSLERQPAHATADRSHQTPDSDVYGISRGSLCISAAMTIVTAWSKYCGSGESVREYGIARSF